MQTKRTLTATAAGALIAASAALFASAPALAGGSSVSTSFSLDLGVGGNASTSGKIEGGTYALGKNGSDAFAQSKNFVKTLGISTVHAGQSTSYGVSFSNGFSAANTNGPGAKAEAFETRKLKFDNFTRFNADLGYSQQTQFSGFAGF